MVHLALARVRALLIDMDGVVYYDNSVLAGVNEFLSFLRENDIARAFVTNGTRNQPQDHHRKLADFGIDARGIPIFTAGMATADHIQRTAPGASVFVIGGDGFRRLLVERAKCRLDAQHPDLVVVGFTEDFDYQQLETACRAIYRGAELIVGDPDVNDPHPDGPTPGAGAFAAAIEAATGCRGLRIGKPNSPLYEMALSELGARPEHAAILGDRLDSDVAGGNALGMGTILVLTGISTEESIRRAETRPDLVVDDLTHLRSLWAAALGDERRPNLAASSADSS